MFQEECLRHELQIFASVFEHHITVVTIRSEEDRKENI